MQILTLLFWVLGAKRISSIKKNIIHQPQHLTDYCFPSFLKGKSMASVILKWSGSSHRKKKRTTERGRRNNEFHQNIWSFSVDMPCLQLPTPTQKRATFIAVEKNHERLSLLCTLWNGIFSGGKKKTNPRTH